MLAQQRPMFSDEQLTMVQVPWEDRREPVPERAEDECTPGQRESKWWGSRWKKRLLCEHPAPALARTVLGAEYPREG